MIQRGRRPRPEASTKEEDRARQEGRQRRVYRVGHSWLLALPRWARERLDCIAGGVIYLHDEGRDEIVVSALPVRPGGRPSGLKLARELAEAKRLIAELHTQRGITRDALFAEWDAQRQTRRIRVELEGVPALGAINERLARIEDHLGYRRGPWNYRPKRGRPRVQTSPGPDHYPGPTSPPFPVPCEEGGVGAGRPLPGQPEESN